ncbi:hypothetical protein GCM10011608_27940 [Micromonospora sonchi]|uniref:Uncharacterized protein n=1 Tax=Micromonospora sonchi TaxID=1763543 RepID=A0A917TWL5_9ACTN|nr:hypothetical protein GCM10011608_27940 [Micromonospora sonchi]
MIVVLAALVVLLGALVRTGRIVPGARGDTAAARRSGALIVAAGLLGILLAVVTLVQKWMSLPANVGSAVRIALAVAMGGAMIRAAWILRRSREGSR